MYAEGVRVSRSHRSSELLKRLYRQDLAKSFLEAQGIERCLFTGSNRLEITNCNAANHCLSCQLIILWPCLSIVRLLICLDAFLVCQHRTALADKQSTYMYASTMSSSYRALHAAAPILKTLEEICIFSRCDVFQCHALVYFLEDV